MAEGGFDDIETKNRNREEDDEEFQEAETKLDSDDNPWDIGDYPENFDEGSPKIKFNRLETLSKLKKDAGNMKR